MVMTAPSKMVIWGTNDRTTKEVRAGLETAALKATGLGRAVVRRALRPLRSRW
jgi:hypothetical protein